MTRVAESAPPVEAAPAAAARPGLLGLLFRVRTFRALEYREFRYLWLGQWATGMGVWMDQVARGWLIYQLTDSALHLGLVRAVQAVPFLFLSPVAGALADRYDRRLQLIVSQMIDAGLYAGLAALIFTGLVQPWHVYVTAIGAATVQVFQQPPRQAMVSGSVPHQLLINAIGLNSVMFNMSRSLGPSIAGLLIAAFGPAASFATQSFLYLLATLWALPLTTGRHGLSASGERRLTPQMLLASTLEGWRFIGRHEAVKVGIIVAMIAGLLAVPFTTLLPVFARDILQAGPTGQGLLLTAMGFGALCSATLIASFGDRVPRVTVMLAGVSLYGVAIAAFATSSWLPLSLVLMGFTGLFHVNSHALIQTVIQVYSPPELRGRMMAVFQQNQVLMTAGGLLAGVLATVWSAPWAIGSMGLACAASVAVVALAFPRARQYR